jgi:hypothetical protein
LLSPWDECNFLTKWLLKSMSLRTYCNQQKASEISSMLMGSNSMSKGHFTHEPRAVTTKL